MLPTIADAIQSLRATSTGVGTIIGTAGDDVIVGSAGNDTIDGSGGNDTICALAGSDQIAGGLGNDRIDAREGDDFVRGDGVNFGGPAVGGATTFFISDRATTTAWATASVPSHPVAGTTS